MNTSTQTQRVTKHYQTERKDRGSIIFVNLACALGSVSALIAVIPYLVMCTHIRLFVAF